MRERGECERARAPACVACVRGASLSACCARAASARARACALARACVWCCAACVRLRAREDVCGVSRCR